MDTFTDLDMAGRVLAQSCVAGDFAEWYPYRVRYELAKIRRSGLPYRKRLAISVAADGRAGQLHRQLAERNNKTQEA